MCGAELKVLPEGVRRAAEVLQAQGHPHMPVMLDDAARTAQQAADALGVAICHAHSARVLVALQALAPGMSKKGVRTRSGRLVGNG